MDVRVGIHVFMALYGLSVFLETPEHLRRGRRRYILASFAITTLSALTASLDVATYFRVLLEATSMPHWRKLYADSETGWERELNVAGMACLFIITDALLVSLMSRVLPA